VPWWLFFPVYPGWDIRMRTKKWIIFVVCLAGMAFLFGRTRSAGEAKSAPSMNVSRIPALKSGTVGLSLFQL
jgi:hypothetical protein